MKGRVSVALGFLALIFVGAVVLAAPFSRADGAWGDPVVSLFTACSAVCVTGLTVVDIAAEFSRTGQIVLLVLVEVGCLGLMTCGTFLLIAIGLRLSLAREFSLMNAYGVAQIQGLKGLICWTVGSMLAVEGIGAALLYLRIGDVYRSIFYSAMSFCNAGFSVDPGSIAVFAGDPWVVFILAAETILGGIGFLVLYNFCTCFLGRRRGAPRGKLSLHARVVLRLTAYLLVLAFAFFLVAEWNGALAPYHGAQRWWVAFYQAVTPRTCGFCIIPTESLRPITRLVYEALMFVGGAPGSAAAGMKVTTFAVLVYTLLAMCRGEQETTLDHRIVPAEIVRESIVIFMALVGFIVLVTGALFITEDMSADTPERLFFEAVSAVTTTGLSVADTTPSLSFAGRCVIMVAMFIGRLGALSVVMLIGDRESKRHVRFPTGEVVVG